MKASIFLLILFAVLTFSACKPKTGEAGSKPETVVSQPEMKKMIIARVYIKPGREADFIEAAKSMIEVSNKEEGCLYYELYQDPYVKTNFIFVESYKNQAAVDFHFAAPYFSEFGKKVGDMVSQPSEIKVIDVAGEK